MGSSNTSNNPQRVVIVQTSVQKCFAQEKVHEITRKNPKSCPKQVEVVQNDQQQLESNNFSIKIASWIWPQGKLPFVIHSSVTQNMKNKLKQAMMEFSQTPIILFEIYSESSYPEFVKFYKSNKNTSYTNWCGRKANRGAHSVHLLETQSKGTYIHEIMHVLGFEHEQCRKDRDDYVTVHSENLQTQNQKHQYEIKPKGYMIGKYDANSIMHYPPTSEMTAKVQNNQMGQRECLSKGDIKGINFVYGDFQCTYDAFPEEYYAQPYYECVDCWDKDTCYGVCELCAVLCHDGHQLIFHPVEKGSNFVCDCGRYEHQTGLCTRKSTNKKYVKQHMYLCYDCFDYSNLKQNDNLLGVCLSCVRKCHKGHSVKYYALSNGFFCDCGLTKFKRACYAQKK